MLHAAPVVEAESSRIGLRGVDRLALDVLELTPVRERNQLIPLQSTRADPFLRGAERECLGPVEAHVRQHGARLSRRQVLIPGDVDGHAVPGFVP